MLSSRSRRRSSQEVFFKAILREKDDMLYIPPSGQQTQVVVRSGDTTVYTKTLEADAAGVVEDSFKLPEDAALGTYTVSVDYAQRPDDYCYWYYEGALGYREGLTSFTVAEYLPAGTYQFVYQIKLVVPGLFRVIPPTAWEFYFPEVYGRGDGMLFEVQPSAR
ncbi:MAG: hypothetical protein JXB30_02265 [Anaerolineae bacterium]|nr:hypothetical protein [Anaerolineae bacterium]